MAFTFNMPSKAELAEKMAARKEAAGGNQQGPREASPFWPYKRLMKYDTVALLRFLPDADRDNPDFFYANRKTIRLRFEGTVGGEGGPTSAEVTVTVPSMEMWAASGEKCPIAQYMRAQKWWDSTPEKKEMALKYYRRHEYVTAGFVVQSPFEETPSPENPIRKFILPKKGVGTLIEGSVTDAEIEDLVVHETGGREFKLKKTKNGDWPDYTQSSWSMRPRALTDEEIGAIEKFGLVDLRKTAWERKPDNDEKDAILALFHDSLNGNPFDIASFGKWYRHFEDRRDGGGGSDSDSGAAVAARANTLVQGARIETPAASAPAAPAAPAEATTASAPAAGKVSAADILARIKAKQS